MIACTDSLVSIPRKASWVMLLSISTVLLLASMGYHRAESEPHRNDVLQSVDPRLVSQHGQMQFVNDADVGRRLSQKFRKPCLLFFTADWCTYCQQMEEAAFTDSAVSDLSGNFICVLVDVDRQPQICKEFSVTSYPTIQFISAQDRPLNRLIGRQSAPDLASGMQDALKRFAWLSDPETRTR